MFQGIVIEKRKSEKEMKLVTIMKRRTFPLVFKEEAKLEDVFKVMQGNFVEPVFLRWP